MTVNKTITRKAQITQVAQNMFSEKGYVGTSMRDLAKEIGIEPASLYSHIRSKEELLQGICDRIANEFFAEISPALESSTDPVVLFREAIRAHIRVITANLDASAVFFNEWRHMTEPGLTEFKDQRHRYERHFKEIIHQGIRQEKFRRIDVNFTMKVIFSSLNGTHEWYRPNGPQTPEQVADNITDFLLEGLTLKQ